MFGKKNAVMIKMNEIASISSEEELSLIEVTDNDTINRIIAAIPEAARVIQNVAGVGMANDLVKKGVYQAILPCGAKLVNSKKTQGAVRGIFRNNNKIAGHADFLPVDSSMEKIAQMNITNAAIGAASMVVGQYYMKHIDDELRQVNDSIAKVADFQKKEYKSKVIVLATQIERSKKFQFAIISDEKLRNEEIHRIQDIENECMELLIHANLSIEELIRYSDVEFEKYEKKVREINEWYKCQIILTDMLFIIADLNYALHLGAMSSEQCYMPYDAIIHQTVKVVGKMRKWHSYHNKKLGIHMDQARVKREGVDAILHKPLELISEKYRFKSIKRDSVIQIRQQMNASIEDRREPLNNLYSENVKLVFKDGKVFYLPNKIRSDVK